MTVPSFTRALVIGLAVGSGAPLVPSTAVGQGEPLESARDTARMEGFTVAAWERQRDLEARFLAVPSPAGAAATGGWLTAAPHMAGSPRQAALADSLAAWLSELGFQVETERFDVYLPHPESLSLELVAPHHRAFGLREGPGGRADDPHTWTWNAYSANGTARGRVVYANYGRAEDHETLRRTGVDVEGAIVLARYGGVYRGTKVREAEKRGAVGVVLYTDPANGGFVAGDTLPLGPFRPNDAVQRGTVSYLWRYPGDPLTPGRPARPGVPRLAPDAALNLPRIPVLNITADQAREVLEALEGEPAPQGFQGGWELPYRVGPGPAELRMAVHQDYRQRPVRNVLARIPGREDQSVIVGVHFDAWVRGGVDPQSGMGAVLEIARALAALRETGWEPRREIVLAFWGGEEFGAVGSTEFVEARRAWLMRDAVAYFNVDVLTAGTLDVSGSPSLRELVWSVATEVDDPTGAGTLADAWLERWAGEAGPLRPPLRPLGVGSDWTAFFHFAGVPSLQWTMNGRGVYAVYHSQRDDFDYLRTHADSALLHTPRMAAVMGLAALRLAEADALPFDYAHYADRIGELVDSVAVAAAEDGAPVPPSDLSSVRHAVGELKAAAARLAERRERALDAEDVPTLRRLNRALPRVEAAFLVDAESPGPRHAPLGIALEGAASNWYRHQIFTSDPASGYGAIPLPGLQPRRVDDHRARAPTVAELERAIRRAADALRRAADATTGVQ